MSVGMHGIRTAGDLVLRMQISKKMRLNEAKEYVAKKLGTDVYTLSDEYAMKEIREELGIGTINAVPGQPKGLKAKAKIAELLDIKIPCVDLMR
ncbi:MAG: dimethylamine---corrinoid protein Co-methyltransferase [Methanolobus sp.]|jgi:dimethylamine--corrinoid protein Co-methyltransferase|nr:dimethylamine---corrinoid protein Co-methyltransferase [Methanolobus sp.]MDK2825816.1 dimethylamine---corrinoid protein Co-methyltransferase [Methanolobus sp.]MDK2948152.1 dimethylamine---corrinoid protein Co-methyltransferase [Methanolobus sp.]